LQTLPINCLFDLFFKQNDDMQRNLLSLTHCFQRYSALRIGIDH
jgi:hypothetical protein